MEIMTPPLNFVIFFSRHFYVNSIRKTNFQSDMDGIADITFIQFILKYQVRPVVISWLFFL